MTTAKQSRFNKGLILKSAYLITLLAAAAVSIYVFAGFNKTAVIETRTDTRLDARVDAALKTIGFSFKVDKDGDAKLVISGLDNDRSQVVFVNSNTAIYRDYDSRKVWSVACLSAKPFPSAKMQSFLERNAEYKIGYIGASKINSKNAIVFVVQIPADASSTVLHSAIAASARTADEIEKELCGGDIL